MVAPSGAYTVNSLSMAPARSLIKGLRKGPCLKIC
jgi:hypothetical protein